MTTAFTLGSNRFEDISLSVLIQDWPNLSGPRKVINLGE